MSFGRAMMQMLELLRLAKRHVSRQSKIKSIALAVIKLHLSEGISE